VVAIAGIIVAVVYLLWAYQQVFHGTPATADRNTPDLRWNERLIVAPLIVLIVLLGVFPKPVLDRITPSVDALVVHVDTVTHTPVPAGLLAATSHPSAAHRHRATLTASGHPLHSGAAGGTGTAPADEEAR
jgi:formate hydrogenlyase subunit 3/multisubunit Na+/H+ antiporter MnhD subunit